MRIMLYPVFAVTVGTSIATAQSPQNSVDISASASFANGAITAQVARKDPPGFAPSPIAKVSVSAALKNEKPFFSTVIEMKPGSSQSVSAPFSEGPAGVTVIVSAMPLDLKEMSPADNVREVSTAILAVVPMTVPILKAGGAKAPSPAPAPAPAPAPSPAPPPTPASVRTTPPAATISTAQLVLVGGAVGATPSSLRGTTLTTPGIALRGGTQGPVPVAPAGMTITTPPITLIGKQE